MPCKFPQPSEGSLFYEDDKLYACLAYEPFTPGHVIVAWKECVTDINLLERESYTYLMNIVENVRTAMLEVYGANKVYMLYMDEARHVHWHLLPRTSDKEGFTMLCERPKPNADFSKAPELKKLLTTS